MSLGKSLSNVVVVLYVALTLFIRFYFQPELGSYYLISVGIGLFSLLFLWALIKSKIIRPSIFNLDYLVNGTDANQNKNS